MVTGFRTNEQVETGRGAMPSELTQRKPIRSRQTPGDCHSSERPETGRGNNIPQDDDFIDFSRRWVKNRGGIRESIGRTTTLPHV